MHRFAWYTTCLLLLALSPLLVAGDVYCTNSSATTNCVGRAQFLASPAFNKYPLYVNSEVMAYAVLGSLTSDGSFSQSQLTQYFPRVDAVSYWQIPWNQASDIGITLGIVKGNITVTTPQTIYYSAAERFPDYRVAIAYMDQGTITSLSWMQTSCEISSCLCIHTPQYPQFDICGQSCLASSANATTCGMSLNVYLLWAGTDSDNVALTSVNSNPYNLQHILA